MYEIRDKQIVSIDKTPVNSPPKTFTVGPMALYALNLLLICLLGYMVYACTGRPLFGNSGNTTIIEQNQQPSSSVGASPSSEGSPSSTSSSAQAK
jgi:hypothetical protein